jgi:hypothetical protein
VSSEKVKNMRNYYKNIFVKRTSFFTKALEIIIKIKLKLANLCFEIKKLDKNKTKIYL